MSRRRNRSRNASRAGTRVITNVARTFTNTPVTAKSGAFAGYSTLLRNNTGGPWADLETEYVVGQKYRVSRLLFNAQLEGSYANDVENLENLALWVMKLPEGYSVATESELWTYPFRHPEWVLGWKFFGNPLNYGSSGTTTGAISQLPVRSRRSTILQPGDSIIAVVTGNGATTVQNHALLLTGIVDYRLAVM